MALPGLKALEREAAGPKTRRFNARVGRNAGRGLVCSAKTTQRRAPGITLSGRGYAVIAWALRMLPAAMPSALMLLSSPWLIVAPRRNATQLPTLKAQRKAREHAENARDGFASCIGQGTRHMCAAL